MTSSEDPEDHDLSFQRVMGCLLGVEHHLSEGLAPGSHVVLHCDDASSGRFIRCGSRCCQDAPFKRSARVVECLEQGRRFRVRDSNGVFFEVMAARLSPDIDASTVQEDHDKSEQSTANASGINQRIALAREMLEVGSHFLGSIVVPGLNLSEDDDSDDSQTPRGSSSPANYRLSVLGERIDELGVPILLVSHAAYGDEQVAIIRLSECDDEVMATFSDMETICNGKVDARAMSISGSVNQLISAEDGFLYPSETATHRFAVKREAHVPRPLHMAKLRQAYDDLAVAVGDWGFKHCDKAVEKLENDPDLLSRLPWCSIQDHAVLQSELVCCLIRHKTEMLNGIIPLTEEEKGAKLSELTSRGVSRFAVHKESDVALSRLQGIGRLIRSVQNNDSLSSFAERLGNDIRKEHYRLGMSFVQFDKAYESFERRLPSRVLEAWVRLGDGESICAICMVQVSSNEQMIALPCGHGFHHSCISRWVRTCSSCPICRRDLG